MLFIFDSGNLYFLSSFSAIQMRNLKQDTWSQLQGQTQDLLR